MNDEDLTFHGHTVGDDHDGKPLVFTLVEHLRMDRFDDQLGLFVPVADNHMVGQVSHSQFPLASRLRLACGSSAMNRTSSSFW